MNKFSPALPARPAIKRAASFWGQRLSAAIAGAGGSLLAGEARHFAPGRKSTSAGNSVASARLVTGM